MNRHTFKPNKAIGGFFTHKPETGELVAYRYFCKPPRISMALTSNNAYIPLEIPPYFGVLKNWDGFKWKHKLILVYLDGTWQAKTLKRWNGTEWLRIDTTGH